MTDETSGKGRPTPSRKEAEASRKQGLSAPRGTKEAKRAAREQQRKASLEARAGLMRGDERYFPAKDRGPVRKAVRDWVDSRFTIGEIFVPMAFIVILGGFVQNIKVRNVLNSAWLLMLLMLIIDCIIIGIQVNIVMRKKFPLKAERRGITAYGIMRAIQIRRFRIPPATVRLGGRPLKQKKK